MLRPIDFLEPLPVRAPSMSLEMALGPLRVGSPVALPDETGWRLVLPADAIAFPTSRLLCDVTSRPLPTLPLDCELELDDLAQHDVWGVLDDEALVGRIDRTRVLASLALLAPEASARALAVAARERLVPRLLHDLANALTVAQAGPELDGAGTGSTTARALEHAAALVRRTRSLYASPATNHDERISMGTFLFEAEPMLRTAARPASLTIERAGSGAVAGVAWRLESVLLNLVLNASEHAQTIEVRLHEEDHDVVLDILDDGPGLDDLAPPGPSGPSRGHGLASVRRQVLLLGGSWEVAVGDAGGTRIRLRFPRIL